MKQPLQLSAHEFVETKEEDVIGVTVFTAKHLPSLDACSVQFLLSSRLMCLITRINPEPLPWQQPFFLSKGGRHQKQKADKTRIKGKM